MVLPWRIVFATLAMIGYACSLTRDVDQHSSLPACTPMTCEDFLGQCGWFTDPCTGISEKCDCLDERRCTLTGSQPDSGTAEAGTAADAGDDASFKPTNTAPLGYCDCQGATGCVTYFAVAGPARAQQFEEGGAQSWKNWDQLDRVEVQGTQEPDGCAKVDLEPISAGGVPGRSEYLRATNFDFSSIPFGACIVGIEVFIDRYAERLTVSDSTVSLIRGNRIEDCSKCNLANPATWPTGRARREKYGECDGLWGAAWAAGDLRDPQFGVAIRVKNESKVNPITSRVCQIRMQVHYTLPGCSTSC